MYQNTFLDVISISLTVHLDFNYYVIIISVYKRFSNLEERRSIQQSPISSQTNDEVDTIGNIIIIFETCQQIAYQFIHILS